MNFDDLDNALETLYGELTTRIIRNINHKYQAAGTYDSVARALGTPGAEVSVSKSKALHDSILDQWKALTDTEKFILLKYQQSVCGEDYRGYEDVDENIYYAMLDLFFDYVSDNPEQE